MLLFAMQYPMQMEYSLTLFMFAMQHKSLTCCFGCSPIRSSWGQSRYSHNSKILNLLTCADIRGGQWRLFLVELKQTVLMVTLELQEAWSWSSGEATYIPHHSWVGL